MSHIITESCIACRFTDCVEVCPVDCFHEGINFLVINPDECIDCGLCVTECPVKAIKQEADLQIEEKHFYDLNYQLSRVWPVINIKKLPFKSAQDFVNAPNKLNLLIK